MLGLPQSVALLPHVEDVVLAVLQGGQEEGRVVQAAALYGGAVLGQLVQEGHARVEREAGIPRGSGLVGVVAETGHTLQSCTRFHDSGGVKYPYICKQQRKNPLKTCLHPLKIKTDACLDKYIYFFCILMHAN